MRQLTSAACIAMRRVPAVYRRRVDRAYLIAEPQHARILLMIKMDDLIVLREAETKRAVFAAFYRRAVLDRFLQPAKSLELDE